MLRESNYMINRNVPQICVDKHIPICRHGIAGSAGNSGCGGAGLASSISGAQIFYAGGGGGGADNFRLPNSNGLGTAGGGNGGNGTTTTNGEAGFAGTANTGGGGGGSANGISNLPGGAGGSGIVIIRYPSYLLPATSTTGSPETYIAGQYRVYLFAASGTITF